MSKAKMSESNGLDEVILLFDPDGATVTGEMLFADFAGLVEQSGPLPEHAASVVKAAYVLVGTGLAVRGAVLFEFLVTEEGFVDSSFNVPLAYLVQNAGAGPDIGHGPLPLACKGQCPVPWHASKLWGSNGDGDEHAVMLVQKAVWRNRLGLKPSSHNPSSHNPRSENFDFASLELEHNKLDERLTQTFGQDGKVSLPQLISQHSQQVTDVRQRYRADLEQQQRAYLEQIRDCRDEIQQLKVSLRNEQERARRLQELLRGEL
jgi:hypothetical protein